MWLRRPKSAVSLINDNPRQRGFIIAVRQAQRALSSAGGDDPQIKANITNVHQA